jgi:methionyl-tRNA formyltransferase
MKKILLLVNGDLGLKVIEFLLSQSDCVITGVVVNSQEKRAPHYLSDLQELSSTLRVFEFSKTLQEQPDFQEILAVSDLAVSALFGHIINRDLVAQFGPNIINLHPSLLPIGRGADPIPWAIIDNRRQGVSIHVIEEKLDAGAIISQCEIDVNFGMTSGQVYQLAMVELLKLFKDFVRHFPKENTLSPQKGDFTLHKSDELRTLRDKLLNGSVEIESSLRIIQALTFADDRKAYMRLSNGELWQVSLSMHRLKAENEL